MQPNAPHTDMPSQSWLLAMLGPRWSPYAQLMRLERPIGAWLLFLPAFAGLTYTAAGPSLAWLGLSLLFLVGSLVMRGAGCIINDLWDRDIDRQVSRTAQRPLASGVLSPLQALIALAICLTLGGLILLSMDGRTLLLGLASLVPVTLYPLAKRFFPAPQLVLGFTFNFGALMGVSAMAAAAPETPWLMPALLLYLGCLFWTLGYDTIYAFQDRDEDKILGLQSLAIRIAGRPKLWIGLFYSLAFAFWLGLALRLAPLPPLAWLGFLALAAHLVWQVVRIDIHQAPRSLALFRANFWTGLLLTLCLGLATWL